MYKVRKDRDDFDFEELGRHVEFLGKTIDLGHGDTHYRRLFDLLSKSIGHPFPVSECLRKIEFETSKMNSDPPAEIKKAKQRLRKALERLRKRMTAAGLDEFVTIERHKVWTRTPGGDVNREPSISMELREILSAGDGTCSAA